MGKQLRELPPPWNSEWSCPIQRCWSDVTLSVYQGKPRKNVCILSTVHTGVGTFSGVKAKQESVIYYNTTKYGVDVLDQMARAYSVKGGTENGPWWSPWSGWDQCPHFIQGALAAGEPREVLQQLAEELRAEYMEGKGAAAVDTRWAVVEANTTTAADMETETVPVRKSCKRSQTSDTWNATSPCVLTLRGEQR